MVHWSKTGGFFGVTGCQSGKGVQEAANTKYKKLEKAAEDATVAYAAAQDAVTNAPPDSDRLSLRALRRAKEDESDAASEALLKFRQKAPKGWEPPVEAYK